MLKRVLAQIVLVLLVYDAQAQLIINEVSQGNTGNREYVEFVVVGNPTCTDTCFDLRNWIIDDNNGFHAQGSGTGIAQGCLRFRNIPQWQCVPYGSIILVYNNADKNTSISVADDPGDANKDKVYIIPVNSNVIEGNPDYPSVPNGSSYSGFTFSTPAVWSYVDMGNANDCFQTVAPSNLTASAFSVGWGNNTQNISIYFAGSAAGKVFYNTNSTNNDPFTQSNWISSNVPSNETPGLPNSTANNNWILSLRNQALNNVPVTTNRSVCILNGQSFFAGGANQTTSGVYNDTLTTVNGCDSIISTNLKVSSPQTFPFNPPAACDSFVYQGLTIKSDTTIRDTLKTTLGCDSLYRVAFIQVKKSKRDTVNACVNTGQSYFAGGANQTTSGFYSDKYTGANGCDSFKITNLKVINPQLTTQTLQSCNSVTLFGVTYTSNATVRDTVSSTLGCDSIYNLYNIIIAPILRDTSTVCINQGQSYFAGGANQTTTGFYADTFQIGGSCDSISVTNLKVSNPTSQSSQVSGCNSYTLNGITYTTSTVVADTIKSYLGCDSVYRSTAITISQSITSNVDVCINNGESYFAGGANQTVSGVYRDTIPIANGCDSIIITNLNVTTIVNGVSDIVACDSFTFKGITYYQAVSIPDTTRNAQGCITSIMLNSIVIKTATNETVNACINEGESYFAGGQLQTLAGEYFDTIPASLPQKCATYRRTLLEVVKPSVEVLPTITANNQVVIQGVTYTESDTIPNVLSSYLGCDSVLQLQPIVINKLPAGVLYLPNVFSPNGDGINEIIEALYNESAEVLSFKIFNRWGEMVYSGTKGWDGYYKGVLQKPDVYVYVLKWLDLSSKKTTTLNGSLSLIR